MRSLIFADINMIFLQTLVALQAHCPKHQRAVVTSNRNFLRSSGGAVGLAVSSAILANVLKSSLPPRLASVANSTFAAPDLSGYSQADRIAIKGAYAAASRAVFIWCVPLVGICFLLSALIKDEGLQRQEERVVAAPQVGDGSPRRSVEDLEKAAIPMVSVGAENTVSVGKVHASNSADDCGRGSIASEKSDKSEHSRPS